jgi:hypothetical protein
MCSPVVLHHFICFFQQPQILIPVRQCTDFSNLSNWICIDDRGLGRRIILEDQEVFGIDWRTLDRNTGFDLPNLATSASVPDVYLRKLDYITRTTTAV